MPRISKAQREENKSNYDDVVYDIFLNEGFSGISYENVAKRLDIRVSTLQGYYPSKNDFVLSIQQRVFPMLFETLDYSSEEAFLRTFKVHLMEHENFLRRAFITSLSYELDADVSFIGIKVCQDRLTESLGEEAAIEIIQKTIGISMMYMLKRQSEVQASGNK